MRRIRFIAALLLLSGGAREAAARHLPPTADGERVAYSYVERVDPCTDGRFNDGRARSCGELLDWLDERDGHWHRRDRHPRDEPEYDPCRDGRVNDGRARTCSELKRHLWHERWR